MAAAGEGNGNVHSSAPEYDVSHMVGFFRQHAPQFRLSADELNHPKPEVVAEIFRWFVQNLTNCKDGTLESVLTDNQENSELEYPQLHESSIPLLKLTLALDRIFGELNRPQFISIKDIIQPSKKRTLKAISILMHFYGFIKGREDFVSGCKNRANQIREEKQHLKKSNDELKERIHSIRVEKEKHEPELNKLKTRKENNSKKLKEKNKLLQTMKTEDELLLNEEKSLKCALESMKEQKAMLVEKDQVLASQIVSSPDKLAAELDEFKRQKFEKEKQLELFNSNINDLVEKQNDFPRVEALLDHLLTSVKKISGEIDKRDQLRKKHEDFVETIGVSRLTLDDATRTLNGRREIHISRCEQLAKLRQQQNLRLVDYQNEITKLKEKIYCLEQEINESEIVSSDYDEQCRNLRKEINNLEREHYEFVNRCNEKHEELMATVDKMNKNGVEFYAMIDKNLLDTEEDDLLSDVEMFEGV